MTQPADLVAKLLGTWPAHRWRDKRLLVAVSGGADSVALLRAIVELTDNRNLIQVAHFNHGWRGADSDADQQFVGQLSQSLGVEFVTASAANTVQSAERPGRSEESARRQRYRFLIHGAYQWGARYVLAAHTASDRIETMLHNLCRGTGLAGVSTPRLTRPLADELLLVRPLIHCYREQIEEYLQRLGQSYRQDTTNTDEKYRRNFLRQTIMPLLRTAYGPHVDKRLYAFSQIAEQSLVVQQQLAQQYWQQAQHLSQAAISAGRLPPDRRNGICLPSAKLLPVAWPILLQVLQNQWQQRQWPQQSLRRSHWELIRHSWEELSLAPESKGTETPDPQMQADDRPKALDRPGRYARQCEEVHKSAMQMLPGEVKLHTMGDWLILNR
ncbi:MAG: tRNA lysidine(34) synthetase TilS [Pirellulaceae bacterium]|nr:tRNA lysidine(34) synthetase TilS [Pirellulaceae bacterium]